jgi:VanZ family protein
MLKSKNILFVLIVLNIVFIFYQAFQDGNASSETSSEIVEIVGEVLEHNDIEYEVTELHQFIRSLAHVIQYFTLGFLMTLLFIKKPIKLYLGGIVMMIDETIQYFTPGRAFEFKDLGLDIMGYSLSIFMVFVIYKIIKGRLLCVELLDMLVNKKRKTLS